MQEILCCQLDIVWENKRANHEKVRALVERAAPHAGSLVVLPEMFATGFSMRVAGITDSDSGETQEFLSALAAEYRVYVLGGIVGSAPDGRGRNECVGYSPEGMQVVRYQKIHPFTLGGELEHYERGSHPQTFTWGGFVVAPFICYDLRFPEIFRSAVRRGATLFPVIASWPAAREHHWMALLKARAIENQAYVAGVNRCGSDPRLSYSGRSQIIGPGGEVLADAGGEEGVIRAEPDLEALLRYRRDLPFLEDMQPEYVDALGGDPD